MVSFAGVTKDADDPLGDDVVITGRRATDAIEQEEVLEPDGEDEEEF